MDEITRQEWGDWKHSKVTKEFLRRIHEKRELLKEGLAEGQTAGIDQDRTIGQCQAIKDILDYAIFSFETLDQEEENAV